MNAFGIVNPLSPTPDCLRSLRPGEMFVSKVVNVSYNGNL